jgi:ankyrin repeat protein
VLRLHNWVIVVGRSLSSRPVTLATSLCTCARLAWLLAVSLLLSAHRSDAAPSASPLLEAIKSSDVTFAISLAGADDVDSNAQDADGTSALMWAVHLDELTVVDALLSRGANPTAVNRYGVSSIYLAAQNGNAESIEMLLERGVDPNTQLPSGETALMTAARTGNVAAMNVLINAGARVDAKEDLKGQTALMWAAAEDNSDAVTVLIAAGADVAARSATGEFTALTFAVRAGAQDAVRALLEAGADANDSLHDRTSMLLLAVTNAHYELAALLLDHGADPSADERGWTALHQLAWTRRWNLGNNLPGAVRTGTVSSLALVRKLVTSGADINARQHREPFDGNRNKLNRVGATPFLLAAKACDMPLLRLLLELGASPSISTADGTTALMAAAGVGIWAPGENPGTHEEALAAVDLLLAVGGGDVNAVNAHGDTALHGAVYRGGAIPVIERLVASGAKLEMTNALGWTPLIVADGVEYTPNVLKRYPEAAAVLRRLAERHPGAALSTE